MSRSRLASRVGPGLQGLRWANEQLVRLRGTLGSEGLDAVVEPPPTIARGSLLGARALLEARRATCLERSLVIQAWFAARGVGLDVIVGVKRSLSDPGDTAHAWVDRFDDDCSTTYAEIRRVQPRLVVTPPPSLSQSPRL